MNKDILENVANIYETKKDYDYINTMLAFDIFKKDIMDKNILEVGCADGAMTEKLVLYTKSLDIIEPSSRYCDIVKNIKGVGNIYNDFSENINNNKKYDVVLLASLIHHIEYPDKFLQDIKKFLDKDSVILATVPNVKSLHRRIGVKMGVLSDEFDDSERNIKYHQFGKFTLDLLKKLFIDNGFEVIESYGYMIKPFSSDIMEKINLNEKQIKAMFEIGKEFQELSSQLYIKAKRV
jgi:2-polyprenyl-3-methyl-5-hydroxy-6-metoxy-1,4-benzoquinol methylase